MRILIAEDEEPVAESYGLILKSRNHDVVITHDGEECLKVVHDHFNKLSEATISKKIRFQSSVKSFFDLIILDHRIPKKNGMEVAEQILSDIPSQRIIIASAYCHEIPESDLAKLEKASIHLMQKPFEFETFLEVVEGRGGGTGKRFRNRANNFRQMLESSDDKENAKGAQLRSSLENDFSAIDLGGSLEFGGPNRI